MKKSFDIKSFLLFIFLTATGGLIFSYFTGINLLFSSAVIGVAIFINGIVIALLDD
ncbi:MAG: hypothetical protein R3E13_10650 [Alphaproteobacteria bacterium]